jgi:hypothetical protein
VARAKTSAKSTRAKAPAVKASTKAAGKPKQPARSRPAPAPTERPRDTPPRQPSPRPPEHDDGPLTGAVRLAGKVADVGLKTAGGLLRRLPGR